MGGSVGGVSLDKLRPYQVPVVRPQVAASDGAIGNALYGDAILGSWLATRIPVLPLPDLCIAFCTNALPKLRNRQRAGAG